MPNESKPTKYSITWGIAIAIIILAVGLAVFINLEKGGKQAVKVIDSLSNAATNQMFGWSHAATNFIHGGFNEFLRATDISAALEPRILINHQVINEGTWPIAELALRKQSTRRYYTWESKVLGSKSKLELKGNFTAKYGYDLKQSQLVIQIAGTGSTPDKITVSFPNVKLLSVEMRDLEFSQEDEGWWNKISKEDRNQALTAFESEARLAFAKAGREPEIEKEIENTLSDALMKSFQFSDKSIIKFESGISTPP